jgi:NadR type nicotinamide-nucleotide adenylyltransferase
MQATPTLKPTVKKVCIIGPECTGKTDLAQFLAKHFNTAWVPEYARGYLNKLNHPYEQADLIKIAHGQTRMEDEWLYESNKVLICDTNLITIKIWSEHKYGNCPEEILERHATRQYDLYLLCNIDVPWETDPQREHPDKREHFWFIYKNEVEKTGIPTVEIGGTHDERRKKAIAVIENLLKQA